MKYNFMKSFLSVLISLVFFCNLPAFATQSTQQQINSLQRQINALKKELKEYQDFQTRANLYLYQQINSSAQNNASANNDIREIQNDMMIDNQMQMNENLDNINTNLERIQKGY
jgi:septal ring factor EnvC (AmiA/AmiB activator)